MQTPDKEIRFSLFQTGALPKNILQGGKWFFRYLIQFDEK